MKVADGKPREPNKLKALVPHVDLFDAGGGIEFVICAVKEAHLDQVRSRFGSAGLEEIPGGDVNVAAPPPKPAVSAATWRPEQRQRPGATGGGAPAATPKLQPKPYGFVPLPDELTSAPPVWLDGSGSRGRLSGEIRCDIETLTPLLVGWERRRIDDSDEAWPVPNVSAGDGQADLRFDGTLIRTSKVKSVLCPLRAPWGDRPVLIPGDSLKGLLRNELGALFGAPMERVAERSYSYRPNSLFPNTPRPRLVSRIARVPEGAVESRALNPGHNDSRMVRVPVKLTLLPETLKYDRRHTLANNRYRFDAPGGATYRGGQGAGEKLNSKPWPHKTLDVAFDPAMPSGGKAEVFCDVPAPAQEGYLNTLRHLIDPRHGHFSERHPDASTIGEKARLRIADAASNIVFAPGDLIWVEWDTRNKCIVSLGWHYYYRWAYVDSVRKKEWGQQHRPGLFPLVEELALDAAGTPQALSAVRRLFGYTGDNDGSKGIGEADYGQLMGRLSVNAALEVTESGENAETRFLPPTFLKELGMPRPSAVEHYLQQPYYPKQRPSDRATLSTYGDAAGYDEPGRLAGRKFYLDRRDAYTSEPWEDGSDTNRLNERSSLAFDASKPGRHFRFTIRFKDLDPAELAAILVALCPHQFRTLLHGDHADGYCSKLGYARPLGWGSVRIDTKALMLLEFSGEKPTLNTVEGIPEWVSEKFKPTASLQSWLAVHRRNHPDAADYPRGEDGNVYTYHTGLRGEHSRKRRYEHDES